MSNVYNVLISHIEYVCVCVCVCIVVVVDFFCFLLFLSMSPNLKLVVISLQSLYILCHVCEENLTYKLFKHIMKYL